MIMTGAESTGEWDSYIDKLVKQGKLRGGSSLAHGLAFSKGMADQTSAISGYIRISAADMTEARSLLEGNPLFEAGGTVAILEEVPD